jgi:hypothetical protein
MTIRETIRKYKLPIAKAATVAAGVALGLTSLDALVHNTSINDIAVNSWNRSLAYDVLGALAGTYDGLRTALNQRKGE